MHRRRSRSKRKSRRRKSRRRRSRRKSRRRRRRRSRRRRFGNPVKCLVCGKIVDKSELNEHWSDSTKCNPPFNKPRPSDLRSSAKPFVPCSTRFQ